MALLRSFSYYGQTAPVILFTDGMHLVNLDGFVNAAGYLQIFDSATNPINGDVPLKSMYVNDVGPLPSLFLTEGPIQLKQGLVVAFSSSGETYTAFAASFSIWGEVEEWERPFNAPGDLSLNDVTTTTDVDIVSKQVWADGNEKSLLNIVAKNHSGAKAYLQLFTTDSPAEDTIPLKSWALDDGETRKFHFGHLGKSFRTVSSAGVAQTGCTLVLSTNGTKLATAGPNTLDLTVNYR